MTIHGSEDADVCEAATSTAHATNLSVSAPVGER